MALTMLVVQRLSTKASSPDLWQFSAARNAEAAQDQGTSSLIRVAATAANPLFVSTTRT